MSKRSKSRMCVLCGERWSQSALGLCRKCERATGADTRTLMERDRDQVLEKHAKAETREHVFEAEGLMPTRQVCVEGRWYDVVWNGSRPYSSLQYVVNRHYAAN